jgi:hypothetical protein
MIEPEHYLTHSCYWPPHFDGRKDDQSGSDPILPKPMAFEVRLTDAAGRLQAGNG